MYEMRMLYTTLISLRNVEYKNTLITAPNF